MEYVLRNINRPILINNEPITNLDEVITKIQDGEYVEVELKPVQNNSHSEENECQVRMLTSDDMRVNHTYIIKVSSQMTKQFDFNLRWNNNIPMPFRIMKGRVLKETRGMLMMDCWVVPLKIDVCMRCGRPLTHPVSRLYGVGPECGAHAYINPFETEEELYASLEELNNKLNGIKWRGWLLKSEIEECQEVRM